MFNIILPCKIKLLYIVFSDYLCIAILYLSAYIIVIPKSRIGREVVCGGYICLIICKKIYK